MTGTPATAAAELNGSTLRIIPRVLHDLLCSARIATPQEGSDPLVSHCAFCGFCYPHRSVDAAGMTTGLTASAQAGNG
ncbi:hypothetical protein AB0B10_25455 [Micromonospora arborensis]|uniref:hypothetical protein n=1 Tax=Micromonospora arborensis TaxID=2116518 RepID=UPI0033E14DE2